MVNPRREQIYRERLGKGIDYSLSFYFTQIRNKDDNGLLFLTLQVFVLVCLLLLSVILLNIRESKLCINKYTWFYAG